MKAILLTTLLFGSGICTAGQNPWEQGVPGPVQCSWLMTEAECSQHRRTLADLRDPAARLAYLEQHAVMMREREVMCGCAASRQVLARAYYR